MNISSFCHDLGVQIHIVLSDIHNTACFVAQILLQRLLRGLGVLQG